MDRHQFDTDDREGMVGELTEQLLREWNRKLAAGDKRATTDLQNTVLDRLSETDAAAIFVQSISDQAGADATFAALVTRVMFDRCEAEVENAIDAMERNRSESRGDNLVAMVAGDRLLVA
jgi:hypothetical protein